jgi:hypothetical protein
MQEAVLLMMQQHSYAALQSRQQQQMHHGDCAGMPIALGQGPAHGLRGNALGDEEWHPIHLGQMNMTVKSNSSNSPRLRGLVRYRR